jgi:hypothetical protein
MKDAPKVKIEWLEFPFRIQEFSSSNLDPRRGYPEVFVVFLSPSNKGRLLPYLFHLFNNHRPQSELLTPLLKQTTNKTNGPKQRDCKIHSKTR